MAKKRKSRASEAPPSQSLEPQAHPEQIPEPEPEPEPEPIQSNKESEVPEADPEDEEEVEYVEEEVEEEGDDEENDVSDGSAENNNQVNGGGDNEDEDEPFEKLLEPFSKDQMVILLKEVVTKHPDFMEKVRKLAEADPAHRKIFVHGFAWDTSTETLTSVFEKYGEIEDCKAVTDKVSGKSKGYGFILFKHRSGARKALKEPQKKIGNRVTSCQLASTGPVTAPPPVTQVAPLASESTQRKIFVSNVSAEVDPQKLLEFFSKFGEIEEGPLGLDRYTGKPKGFCLFVYKSLESAKKALEEPHKDFQGLTLHCQRAIDGPKPTKGNYPQQQQQQQQHHHYGQQQHRQQYYGGHPAKKGKYSGGSGSRSAGSTGHLMAPATGPAVGYNPAVAAAPGLTPALGQALTALLASQGAAGIGNLLGGFGGPVTQGVPPVMTNGGYGGQAGGGYGQPGMQGGYHNPQMGYQGPVRPQQGGGYMSHSR